MSGHEKDTTPAQNRSSSESAKGEAKAGGIDKKLLQEAIGLASTPEMLAALEKALKSGTFNADFVKSMGNSANDTTESISIVQQETGRETESSKEADIEELNRTDLMKMLKGDLINLAKKYKVSETGTKAALCDSILKAYESEKANCNESMKRKHEDDGESNDIGANAEESEALKMKKSVVYMCLYFRIILFKIRVLPKSSSEAFPTLELLPKKLLILAFLPSSSPGISQTLFLLMFLRLFLCDGIFVYFDFCKQLLESRLFFATVVAC